MAYAANTDVPFERSISEIIVLLKKAGADQIAQIDTRQGFELRFTMADRMVRFRVLFPDAAAIQKMCGPRQDPSRVGEQWRRQRGRALLLVIKAKLESIESQVETFEQAFLANVVMADGATLYDRVKEPIALEYESGKPTMLMLEGPGRG
ncbi:hypothetical protein [Rhizorhabdus sp.]|uniref:hypothetical protein n=1 Tax=Rhizorhabdus sp. TaxID=1968843 RepID=UPI0035B1F5CD